MALDFLQVAVLNDRASVKRDRAAASPRERLAVMAGRLMGAQHAIGARQREQPPTRPSRRVSVPGQQALRPTGPTPARRVPVPRRVAVVILDIARRQPEILRSVARAATPSDPGHGKAVRQINETAEAARHDPEAARTLAQMRIVNRVRMAIGNAQREDAGRSAAIAKRQIARHVITMPDEEREAARDTAARAIDRIDTTHGNLVELSMRASDVQAIVSPPRAFSIRMYDEDLEASQRDDDAGGHHDDEADDDSEEWHEDADACDDDGSPSGTIAGVVSTGATAQPLGSLGARLRRFYRAGQNG